MERPSNAWCSPERSPLRSLPDGEDRLKVLLVCNGFPPSGQWGTEYYTHQLATGLRALGDDVVVLHPVRETDRERFSVRRVERYGIPVIEVANSGDPQKRFADSYRCEGIEAAFDAILSEEQPDVVHFMHLLWGLSIRLPVIARERGIRTVVTPTDFGLICHRGQLFDWNAQACEGPGDAERCAHCVRQSGTWDLPPLRRRARSLAANGLARLGGFGRVVVPRDIVEREASVRQAMESVDHWILPTRTLWDSLREWGIGTERASQLYYGIDESLYRRERPAVQGAGKRFVYMSQYMPHKGLACLIEATRLLQSRLPESVEPWRVELYGNGTGDRHRRYADEVLAHPLPVRVVDRGPFEPLDAPEVLASTDCVLVPSEWRENAPLTLLQARAAGVPAIASDVPGIAEVFEDGRHGLLFEAGNAADLARAMGRVILGEMPGFEPDPLVQWREHLWAVRDIQGGRVGHELQPQAGRAELLPLS